MMFRWFLQASLCSFLFASCGTGNSPTFPPGTVLTIKGKFENADGTPLTGKRIQFQNLREFGYVDTQTSAVSAFEALFAHISLLAFPFFLFWQGQESSETEIPPGFYLENVSTDSLGIFEFSLQADRMLRDSEGGININILNEKQDVPAFAKFSFVLKEKDTDLGIVRLCDQSGLQATLSEDASAVQVSWTKSPDSLEKHVIRIGMQEENTAIWSQDIPGDVTVFSLPTRVIQGIPTHVAVESFLRMEEDFVVSCLSAPINLPETSTESPHSSEAQFRSSTIPFTITSLHDENFSNSIYFQAFNTNSLEIEFNHSTPLQELFLYNLKLESEGEIIIETSVDGKNWLELSRFDASRFLHVQLDRPILERYVKFVFPAPLIDLQELRIY